MTLATVNVNVPTAVTAIVLVLPTLTAPWFVAVPVPLLDVIEPAQK